jgi:hypothetical protein
MKKVLRLDRRNFILLKSEIFQMGMLFGQEVASFKALQSLGLDVTRLPTGTQIRLEVVADPPRPMRLEDDR